MLFKKAYKYTLETLQRMGRRIRDADDDEKEVLPFAEHFIDLQPNVSPPLYLTESKTETGNHLLFSFLSRITTTKKKRL